jgi:hypothetical protein
MIAFHPHRSLRRLFVHQHAEQFGDLRIGVAFGFLQTGQIGLEQGDL